MTRNQFVRKHTRVRIRRSEIDKLACQAQSARIFAEREYLSLRYERKFLVPFFIGVLRAECSYLILRLSIFLGYIEKEL